MKLAVIATDYLNWTDGLVTTQYFGNRSVRKGCRGMPEMFANGFLIFAGYRHYYVLKYRTEFVYLSE